MIREPFQEPGMAGTYDAETSIAGLDFGEEMLSPFFEPNQANWRSLLAAYHEWVHYYQYHATTYGYLHKVAFNTQILLINGILRVARQDRRRIPLPLAPYSTPLVDASSKPISDPILANRRVVALLQELRDGLLGFGPHISMKDLPEWSFASRIMGQLYGGPQAIILEADFLPEAPKIRYPVRHLIEAHAHFLSSMWLMCAVDRVDGDRRIITAVAELANEQLIGPYSAFANAILAFQCREDQRVKYYCALAELALTTPGFHRHPQQLDTLIAPVYTSGFPVVRMETLLADAIDGFIAWPEPGWPACASSLIESVIEARRRRGDVPAALLPGAEGASALPTLERIVRRIGEYAEIEDDVPTPLLAFQLDGLAKLCLAEKLRSRVPLLLAGFVIEELKLLVGNLAGPTTVTTVGSQRKTLIGLCSGLLDRRLILPQDLQAESDWVVTAGAPIAYVLHKLILASRSELEEIADRPVFGSNPWTPRSVLAEHYGLSLSDFG